VSVRFENTAVLVAGGTSGIGLAIADAFADAGASVTIAGTRQEAAHYGHGELERFAYRELVLTGAETIACLPSSLPDGRLDVLVNDAGANVPGGRDEWEPAVFAEALTINLSGTFQLSVACRSLLAASPRADMAGGTPGASIVNLASMTSYGAAPMVPGYGAAKAGNVQVTKTLAVQWAAAGIRVNAIAPGLVETGMTQMMKPFESLWQPMIDRAPLGRWADPADVAPSALFLASSAARYISGSTLDVDGGYRST